MRIGVATGATQIVPVIDRGGLRLELGRFLVAIRARHRHMPTRQYEMCLLVLGQSEGRGLVCLKIVTTVARIEIRSRGKLGCMLVDMTIGAALKLNFEQCFFTLRDVALGAFQTGVSAL